jgi:hypothetical protein
VVGNPLSERKAVATRG